MTWLSVTLFEYKTNKKIGHVYMASHCPAVGEFYVNSTKIDDTAKDNMYIVRAVTHFQDNKIALHIQKYDAEAEQERWDNMVDTIHKLGEKYGSEKSEENN